MSNDQGQDEKTAKGITMTNRDMNRLIDATDIPAALGLLTRLPVPVDTEAATARGAAAAWAYPLVGIVVSGLAAIFAYCALWVGLPATIAAAVFVATQIIVTGALHEDGMADSADGLWGGWDAQNRLRIMKDSAIGTYGVLALVLSVGIRWVAVGTLLAASHIGFLLAAALISRAAMVILMHLMPNARRNGLSHSVGAPTAAAASLAIAICALFGLFLIGFHIIAALVIAAGGVALCGLIAHTKIKGQTGDILGATQQISEIAVLLTGVALLAG